jgi:hypothetical protein
MLARAVIFLIGWHPLDPAVAAKLNVSKRRILVFSHTSYWDFYIFAIYLLAYRQVIPPVRTLVKPQPFAYAGGLLRWLGAIPATQIEDKNGGCVDRVVKELSVQPNNAFMISPKGTILKHQWRSGYYHIAQKLAAPISVVGLDYEMHCVGMSDEIASTEEEAEVKQFCYSALSKIVPLHPAQENMEIRTFDKRRHGIIGSYWPLLKTLVVIAGLLRVLRK